MENDGVPLIAYFGLIIPLAGMGMGALAIWTEHKRKQMGIETLKTLAAQGKDPSPAFLEALEKASTDRVRANQPVTARMAWAQFGFFLVMALGFAGFALYFHLRDNYGSWVFVLGFGVTAFVMAAIAAARFAQAILAPKDDTAE